MGIGQRYGAGADQACDAKARQYLFHLLFHHSLLEWSNVDHGKEKPIECQVVIVQVYPVVLLPVKQIDENGAGAINLSG